jgi:dTDP-4-dehydrorhamnose reductase
MKRALVLGANGLLGQHLVRALASRYEVAASDLQDGSFTNHDPYFTCDIAEKNQLNTLVKEVEPRIVVNAAAMTDVDGCETKPELARRVNAEAVGHVGELALEISARVIHVSTDYVFDGENGPYGEDDKTNPVGIYGATKLEGEQLLTDSGAEHAIVRTNVLYGCGVEVKSNFALWVYDSLRAGKTIGVVTDQFNNPTEAGNLAEALAELAVSEYTGVVNVAGADFVDRYAFALQVASVFELDDTLIQSTTTAELDQAARRPPRGGLRIEKASSLLSTELLGIADGLERMKSRMST